MQWFYGANGQRQGPVSEAEFEQLVANGTIKDDTVVWRDGMREWQPYSAVAPVAAGAGRGSTADETQVCAVSGKRYPVSQMIQYEGKWISAEHRDAYFQRLREGVVQPGVSAVPGPYGYGGFWKRFCAAFIDGIILWVVNQAISVLVAVPLGLTYTISGPKPANNAGDIGRLLLVLGLIQVISMAVALTYEIGFIRKFDATPGKMALGLKLLRTDGSKLSVGRIIGRYFAKVLSGIILLIGYIMAAFDDERRALHDRICDTRVVKTHA